MRITLFPAVASVLGILATGAIAGQEIAPAPETAKTIVPVQKGLPAGTLTLGGKFSEHLTSGYFDALIPVAQPGDLTLFISGRALTDDRDQQVYSIGGGARYLVPTADVILGVNVFYDSIESQADRHYDQLGFGFEMLTRWVDARFNYYLPDSGRHTVDRHSRQSTSSELETDFVTGGLNRVDTNRREKFEQYESALEGWNAEAGVLIPWLDRYSEVRIFGGYYHYNNPFGHDFQGFKGRVEARLLPGLIADLEYWDDAALTGGHWIAGARVSVPFDFGNLLTGRNPFAGAGEMFTPHRREFRDRLGEQVIRSHRVMTVKSNLQQVSESVSTDTSPVVAGTPPPSFIVRPPTPPPIPVE